MLGEVESGVVVVWAGGELVERLLLPLSHVDEEADSVVAVLLLLLIGGLIVLDALELESDLVTVPPFEDELDASVEDGVKVAESRVELVTGGGVVVVVEAEVDLVDRLLPLTLLLVAEEVEKDTDLVLLLLREEPVASEVLEVVAGGVVPLLRPVDDSPGVSRVVSVEVLPDVLPRLVPGDVVVNPLERDDEDDDV